jgi:hypothetical protein
LEECSTQNDYNESGFSKAFLNLVDDTVAPRDLSFIKPSSNSGCEEGIVQRPDNASLILTGMTQENVPLHWKIAFVNLSGITEV